MDFFVSALEPEQHKVLYKASHSNTHKQTDGGGDAIWGSVSCSKTLPNVDRRS